MAKSVTTTRRAAIVGAAASAVAIATPALAAEPITLEQLFRRFKADAMAIDPRITGAWLGYDMTAAGANADRLMSIYFERDHAPFVRKS